MEAFYKGEMAVDEYYANFAQEKGEPLSIGSLERKLERLEGMREERVKALKADYDKRINDTIAQVREVRNRVAGFTDEQMQDRENTLKELDKTLEKLNASTNLDQLTKDTLYNEDPVFINKRGEPLGDEPLYRKGLAHQLDYIKNDTELGPAEKERFLVFLDQSLDKYETEISGNLFGNLHIIQEQVEAANELFDQEPPKGGKYTFHMVAVYDAVRAFEIISEWTQRKLKRSSTKRIGQFGSQGLKFLNNAPWPLKPFNTLSNEFDREQENAEQEEVNQYKEAYKNKDAWQVEAIAYNSRNQDELKACLYLLAEQGRLRWDRIELLKRLNYFQKSVHFDESGMKGHLGNISLFYEKLGKACGAIWDFDTFKDLKTQNSSAYDSKKNEWDQACHEWAETVGLDTIIDGYLQDYKKAKVSGRNPTFDPLAYEKIIDYAIKYGKMGSEQKLYFLIQGIAWGILPPDRGSVLNSIYINEYPAIDYFGTATSRGKKPTLENFEEVAALDENAF